MSPTRPPRQKRPKLTAPALAGVPVEVVIDHRGGVKAAVGLRYPQFRAVFALPDSDRASAGQPWSDPAQNVPVSRKAGRALDQLFDWVPDAATRHRILVDDPARLYGV